MIGVEVTTVTDEWYPNQIGVKFTTADGYECTYWPSADRQPDKLLHEEVMKDARKRAKVFLAALRQTGK